MHFRALSYVVTIALFSLIPNPLHAAGFDCVPSYVPDNTSLYFTNGGVEYSAENLLSIGLSASSTLGQYYVSVQMYDDSCNLLPDLSTGRLSIPGTSPDTHIVFVSGTQLDIVDDITGVVLRSKTFPKLPSYIRAMVTVSQYVYGTGDILVIDPVAIMDGEFPPIIDGQVIESDPSCPPKQSAGGRYGDFFDKDYERAEYVDGLLRVQLRLGTVKTINAIQLAGVLTFDAECNPIYPAQDGPVSIGGEPYLTRYFSFRMISPTEWILWDDEQNLPMVCIGCSGTIDVGVPQISFLVFNIANGTEPHYVYTTPHPPTENSGCVSNCNSSILFLPGIMSSSLYKGSDKLWEPSSESQVQGLYLDSNGQSIDPNIYSKGVIDEVGPLGSNIYKSFLEDLSVKKGDVFEDYAAIPYDWRLSINDIVSSGKETVDGGIFYNKATSTPYIIQTLRHLVETSRTGKVSIIAHSNGGLVAKALVNELGAEAPGLIDQIIFVAVPQLGTPQAIGALLHGYETGIPFDWLPLILSPERAREFAQNAPMSYQLLPESGYYQSVESSITTPLVSFESGVATQAFIDSYGSSIDDTGELYRFLIGQGGRSDPNYNDLDNPSIVNEELLSSAELLKQSIGASWQAPLGIKVHQIAGVGENTLAGITYKSSVTCSNVYVSQDSTPTCLAYEPSVIYTPEEVIDGDGTVVAPSALAMSDVSDGVHRWWVNLNDYNGLLVLVPAAGILRTKHADLLEVAELRELVFELISNDSPISHDFITREEPVINRGNHLRFILHSPLSLSAVDSTGNIVGSNSVTIPGATYKRYGEVQVVHVPTDSAPTIKLNGVASGSFTLEVEQYADGALIATTTFSGIPSATSTVATISFPDGTIAHAENLKLDYDGDSVVDAELEPSVGEVLQIPRPSIADTVVLLREYVSSMEASRATLRKLNFYFRTFEKKIYVVERLGNARSRAKDRIRNIFPREMHDYNKDRFDKQKKDMVLRAVNKFIRKIKRLGDQGKIKEEDLDVMLHLVSKIKGDI